MSYQPPPPPYQPPQPGQMYGGVAPTNQKAIWSLVAGILNFACCPLVGGIVAIVLGHQAKQEIRLSGGTQQGEGMAQVGYVLGIIGTILSALGVIIYVTLLIIGIAQCQHAGSC